MNELGGSEPGVPDTAAARASARSRGPCPAKRRSRGPCNRIVEPAVETIDGCDEAGILLVRKA